MPTQYNIHQNCTLRKNNSNSRLYAKICGLQPLHAMHAISSQHYWVAS